MVQFHSGLLSGCVPLKVSIDDNVADVLDQLTGFVSNDTPHENSGHVAFEWIGPLMDESEL